MGADGRRAMVIVLVILVPLLHIAAWGLTFAGSAGMLPWQPEPTRIPITPFAGLSGMGVATPGP
jgi:hypothetical protein